MDCCNMQLLHLPFNQRLPYHSCLALDFKWNLEWKDKLVAFSNCLRIDSTKDKLVVS